MKKLTMLVSLYLLSGCATTDYTTIPLSNASLSNLKTSETGNIQQREHTVTVSFDYAIENFNEATNLYTCSVLFINVDGTAVTSTKSGKKHPCILDSANGSISVSWPTPLDKSRNAPQMVLSRMKYPIEYFVTIHQKTGKHSTKLIAKSEVIKSRL
ncbi:hypothetical protein HUZ36_17665 [Pseudoalteromonas sp. McH1-7]|uniref:hypothetical protein n=1 Tax=Pseudoalteromonas TaxID=53246 RepID=UPI00159165F4|nr:MULTISPECIES: hypothetical protein [Pseudoalteromonas]MDW7549036.1 hypothetical protein [Pseudoalteromonas peptidolytica]NUZ12612.1 hypothetical protein [Pseudoalteromonas sp. McH1-7]USD30265.1 hypothetical protein J8Z24_19210 [Pseudoalteromonas sp. SCSIO 43201]